MFKAFFNALQRFLRKRDMSTRELARELTIIALLTAALVAEKYFG